MKRDLPAIIFVASFSLLFVARNWLTWLIVDSFWSFALPALICLLLLVLCIASAILWFMAKTNPTRSYFVSTVAMLACVACSILCNELYLRGLPPGSYASVHKPTDWQGKKSQERTANDLTARQKMLGDVVTRILPDSNRTTVEKQLGAPDSGYFTELKPDLLYCLGPQREGMFKMDSEWLAIWFSRKGTVDRWAILTD